MTKEIVDALLTAMENRRKVALVSLCSTDGSVPQNAGAKMLVFPEGTIMGTIGGGSLEHQVIIKALAVLEANESAFWECSLKDLGMVCGGKGTVYIECFS